MKNNKNNNMVALKSFPWHIVCFLVIIVIFIFLRTYQLEARLPYGFDQVTWSWAMKNMIADGKIPLLGAPAKGNSGFSTGALYYYLLYPFFLIFNLDPIALAWFMLIVSGITFFLIYIVSSRIFDKKVGIISMMIYTFSYYLLINDRVAWNAGLMPLVSLVIFYLLVKILEGNNFKLLLVLGAVCGFAFHIHFTAVFFPIIILLLSPFIIIKRPNWKYIVGSLITFGIFLIPMLLSDVKGTANTNRMLSYISTYYHGFHLRRVIQLFYDAFIQIGKIFVTPYRDLNWLLFLTFCLVYWFKEKYKSFPIILVSGLFFLVPWFILSLYSGEISDYYFFPTLPLGIMMSAYLTDVVISGKNLLLIILVSFLWMNIWKNSLLKFFKYNDSTYLRDRKEALEFAKNSKKIEFQEGNPKSYLNWYFLQYNKNAVK